jgi:hypothetical protein
MRRKELCIFHQIMLSSTGSISFSIATKASWRNMIKTITDIQSWNSVDYNSQSWTHVSHVEIQSCCTHWYSEKVWSASHLSTSRSCQTPYERESWSWLTICCRRGILITLWVCTTQLNQPCTTLETQNSNAPLLVQFRKNYLPLL